MGSLERTMAKQNQVRQLEHQIEVMEQVEVRQLVILACYEALAGSLEGELMQGTNKLLEGAKFKTREELYKAAFNAAKTVLVDLEYEAAAAATKLEAEERSAAPGSPDTLSAAVSGLQLTLSDTSDTSEGEPTPE